MANFGPQRTAIANASRAAITNDVETDGFEGSEQPRVLKIASDDTRAWREARLHPGLGNEPTLRRSLRDEAGTQHDTWIRCIGARCDCRNHHRAVFQLYGFAVNQNVN